MRAAIAGMDWEVCGPAPGQPRTSRITVNLTRGRVSITSEALRLAGNPEALVPLYSPEHKTIGLRPVQPTNPNALLVSRTSSQDSSRHIAAAGIARRLVADGYKGSISMPVQWHPDGLLWGDLTMATQFTRRMRPKGGAA